jgi:pyridoxal phosphate-dependent aminotransferase EpsN
MPGRILLSPPHVGEDDMRLVAEAVASSWLAPAGPHLEEFEREFCRVTGAPHAVAVTSGTAALQLALHVLGIGPGDEVAVSTLTFIGSVGPIVQRGAVPVFIDSEEHTWNMDPALLCEALDRHPRIRAVIVVHLYGQPADIEPMMELCDRRGIPLIEDAAEALGATYRGRHAGTLGRIGCFSFNGNKIITTSGGGMLVSDDERLTRHARKLATQAREPAPHYEHAEVGYNFRLSNVLAALGLAQLRRLDERVEQRRRNFSLYEARLGHLPGLRFMPEAPFSSSTRWLTALTIDPDVFGISREDVRQALDRSDIEARPVWKPMHLQPALRHCPAVLSGVADRLFNDGLCLPSGSSLTEAELERVVAAVWEAWTAHVAPG